MRLVERRDQRSRVRLAVLFCALLTCAPGLRAHPLAPSLLELTEEPSGRVRARWRQPLQLPAGARLEPLLPAHCAVVAQPVETVDGVALLRHWAVDCGARGLSGARIEVGGLAMAGSDVLLRAVLSDGRVLQTILRAHAPAYTLPAVPQGRGEVASSYLRLGIEHLLTGWDHLAFVLGLCLLVAGWRRLLGTITAFTFGHSLTLSAAALGFVRVPPAPVEALIALSILTLAIELARPQRSALGERPWLMAAGFGLLHGLGFAGALAQAGLPHNEIPLALCAFNLGIEAGQLAFVGAVLVGVALLARVRPRLPAWSAAAPTYAIGVLAAYWTFERLAQL